MTTEHFLIKKEIEAIKKDQDILLDSFGCKLNRWFGVGIIDHIEYLKSEIKHLENIQEIIKDQKVNKLEEKTYQTQYNCGNCQANNDILEIPLGKSVKDFLDERKILCRNCKCQLFKYYSHHLQSRFNLVAKKSIS